MTALRRDPVPRWASGSPLGPPRPYPGRVAHAVDGEVPTASATVATMSSARRAASGSGATMTTADTHKAVIGALAQLERILLIGGPLALLLGRPRAMRWRQERSDPSRRCAAAPRASRAATRASAYRSRPPGMSSGDSARR